ncbi:extracellular solute-binding protein [Actinobacteria bacterium YIM 96077]|uniref:Sugar ABC transporter substrate-binding protein n=1 Tax=Phytoactinopolyspora halophila TaxID=1981511 RepID=A0A329R2S6_9ACTN|nr:extracellular solute-binding protein [Phytoactinopolyspora halophila]AYY11887.1 extracellular solute-binding protein [Actinobacteria bacterium YIM 96077]RAW18880.1 sugar ABC transporter substrate-binding protein [Phytoactinopolyspora halophila]
MMRCNDARAFGRRAAGCAMVTTLLMVTACGGDSDSAEAGGDVTLRFAWWGNQERAELTQQAIDVFTEENPNIGIEPESVDFDSYFDRLATSVAADDAPDVFTLGGAYPREYGDRGALLDLSTVEEHLSLDNIDEAALSNGFFSGVQYGVPTGVNTYAVVANPEVFEEAGVEMPDDDTWTWDDFVEIAQEISDNTPDDTYGAVDPTGSDALDLYSRQRGESLYTEDGEVGISEETVQDWWDMTSAMSESGATPPASITAELAGQAAPEQTLMGRGLAGMQLDWSNQLNALRSASGAPLELLRAPGETSNEAPGMWLQASQVYAIGANTDHPEEAAQLVDFLVNSVEAAEFTKADRGIPANSEVLEAITPKLDEDTTVQSEFVAEVTPEVGDALIIGPTGSTETPFILERLNDEVLFGRVGTADAASQFVERVAEEIDQG